LARLVSDIQLATSAGKPVALAPLAAGPALGPMAPLATAGGPIGVIDSAGVAPVGGVAGVAGVAPVSGVAGVAGVAPVGGVAGVAGVAPVGSAGAMGPAGAVPDPFATAGTNAAAPRGVGPSVPAVTPSSATPNLGGGAAASGGGSATQTPGVVGNQTGACSATGYAAAAFTVVASIAIFA
jgi:hypothetical protein